MRGSGSRNVRTRSRSKDAKVDDFKENGKEIEISASSRPLVYYDNWVKRDRSKYLNAISQKPSFLIR